MGHFLFSSSSSAFKTEGGLWPRKLTSAAGLPPPHTHTTTNQRYRWPRLFTSWTHTHLLDLKIRRRDEIAGLSIRNSRIAIQRMCDIIQTRHVLLRLTYVCWYLYSLPHLKNEYTYSPLDSIDCNYKANITINQIQNEISLSHSRFGWDEPCSFVRNYMNVR